MTSETDETNYVSSSMKSIMKEQPNKIEAVPTNTSCKVIYLYYGVLYHLFDENNHVKI